MKKKGFTLIEIIVVLIILSILSTLAFSSYFNWVTRSNAAEAALALKQYADAFDAALYVHGAYGLEGTGGYCSPPSVPTPSSPNFIYSPPPPYGCVINTNPYLTYYYILTATITPGDGQGPGNYQNPCSSWPSSGFTIGLSDSTVYLCRNLDSTRNIIGTGIYSGMF
ncbi:MAG: prepilin-type N-terminal cleavage/methylation domain-containing protein [Candidatus Omnitrophica bacterium]|nr:prepilin-type N-terminal cleavage/methylation domain-containing protein [Candidatus Omnitrophota bacterium]